MSDLKTYTNKNLGQFTSIPIRLMDDSSQLDSLYLSSHFYKLRTQTVAHLRKSKHYAATLAAWQKKLKGVDTTDLAAVAKTLELNVEVFNPLASSSEPRTLFSGGGRSSKRKAQLLKVKKDVYKPMKAGAPSRETYEEGLAASNARAEAFRAKQRRKEDWIRILKDENSTEEQIQRCVEDDEIYIDTFNEVLNEVDRQPPDTLIMRKRKINLQVENKTAVIPDSLQKCEIGRNLDMEEESIDRDGITYPKGWPECPISAAPIGLQFEGQEMKWKGEYYYTRDPSTSGKILCYNIDHIDKHRRGQDSFIDPYSRRPVVMLERLWEALTRSSLVSSRLKSTFLTLRDKLLSGVKTGNIELVKIAMEEGADVNAKDNNGWTPLHWIAWKGHLEVVRALIEAGADVNAKNKYGGETPLYWSARNGHPEVARALIDAGADVNAKDNVGWTPLFWSARNGHLEVARDLIKAGADVNAKSIGGSTPLHLSASGRTPLHLEVARDLIEAGADVNAEDNTGNTPLHESAENGHLEVVQALIQAGADVNAKAKNGDWVPGSEDWTPLHFSAFNGHHEVSRALIEAGAGVNAKTDDGYTPLHLIVLHGRLEVVKYLIEAGADVSAENEKGQTPLHLSANAYAHATAQDEAHVNLEVTRLLIRAGANMNAEDRDGRTPLDIDPRLAEFQRNVRPRQGEDDEGQDVLVFSSRRRPFLRRDNSVARRNVRQRVGGGGANGIDVDLNADSRVEDDAALAKAIEVLFGKMNNLKLKIKLLAKLT